MNIIHKESRSKRTLSVSRCLRDAKAPGECLGESFCHKVAVPTLKGRKQDKHTHSSSRLPLHKHAGTRKTRLQGSPKPLDHSVSN